MPDPVRYEQVGAAAVVTIDRPERRNAVDGPTAEALHEAYQRFEADDDARVHGPHRRRRRGLLRRRRPQGDRDLRAAARRCPTGPMGFTRLTPSKPTIAAIDGLRAWPAGSSSRCGATCGSRRTRSTFGCPERRWGVPLIDGGTQRLPRIVGLGRALDLILIGPDHRRRRGARRSGC